ncbi:hypothetical protein J0656_05110 [Muricauda ruestringensis]|uniref:MORN repeat protein n=1 Tax=Flagellimonas aurea TaxID=2915619 RepID=A0ABS3G1U7_9FLAO|nr:hypothetical protein [Allomuricauda aurea]MBO0353389.1 hypothetical protein [Allomuricauda aurea]
MGKFRLTLALAVLSTLATFAQQSIKCVKGDCQNGYGFATLSEGNKEIGYQVGFHENQLLQGIGNQTGEFGRYWGMFKNGKKEGFFSYESEGNMYAFGGFVDGKREGLHVIRNKAGYEFRDYQNGRHISNSPLVTTGVSPCVMGNCENGKGVKVYDNDAVYSNWKNGQKNGMTMEFLMSEKKIIFSEFVEGIVDGLQMIWHFDGSKEIMQMQNGAISGQYLKRNQNNTHEAAMYKYGQLTTSL